MHLKIQASTFDSQPHAELWGFTGVTGNGANDGPTLKPINVESIVGGMLAAYLCCKYKAVSVMMIWYIYEGNIGSRKHGAEAIKREKRADKWEKKSEK